VKVVSNPFAAERAAWTDKALTLLARRGYPIPTILWRGALDGNWSCVVQQRVPGEALHALSGSALDALFSLVDLQATPDLDPGGWDISWWMSVVLFERWEHWWERVEKAVPQTSRRLRAFLEPAWGFRLPADDIVHGDLNLTNVIAHGGTITGIVDWDDIGLGSRAADLSGLLFDWHRLRLSNGAVTLDGGARIVDRIADIAGVEGLRCAIGYGAIARIALTAERGDREGVATWCRVTDAIMDAPHLVRLLPGGAPL
jgi:aminoglycoside phosphotransferase (APT) family kinase protein